MITHVTLSTHEPLMVNTIGHSLGAILFAVFFLLVMRSSRLPAVAAALAFIWNAASLSVLAMNDWGWPGSGIFVSIATSALCLLPAVLLDVSLARRSPNLVRAGYAVGIGATILHAFEHFSPGLDVHRIALIFTTAGFVILTPLSLWAGRSDARSARSRLVAAMALFLFAITFVHYGSGDAHGLWSLELLVHHAGVPLALVILLQDYRFVLVDVFVRMLASLTLAGVVLLAGIHALGALGVSIQEPPSPFRQGMALVAACLLLFLYGTLRGRLQYGLTRVLFGRSSLDSVSEQMHRLCSECPDENSYLDRAAALLGEFLQASTVPVPEPIAERLNRRQWHYPATAAELELNGTGIEAVLPLRLGSGELKLLAFGHRRGGRRYLSEDLETLARLATILLEHVEHFRTAEMRRLVSQAELRALESQIHPHFIFNALNTLYGVIPKEARGARATVLNLADILRYFLQRERTYISLEEEMAIIRSYLEIEKLRLGDRLRTEFDVQEQALHQLIPLLSLEPLVENSIKHGISQIPEGGLVRIFARMDNCMLHVRVEDTGSGFSPSSQDSTRGAGVGLQNVRRRLALCYGPEAELEIASSGEGTSVGFRIPAQVQVGAA
ncbi:MAG TPA: histidine kinase [Bryobacteraceae bacterium]|nr:histidine kinase [Bryobacteraceae bacterium]